MHLTRHLREDTLASVVVFFVAVPLCLGIALASGAPLLSGLIAGIVGGIVVGMLSRSQLGVSGPAAGLAVIVFTAIGDLGFEAFLVAVVLAGVLQIILGLCRAGLIAHFFPSSVIKGMLAGIGVIIILKQIPHAFGHDSDPQGDLAFRQPDGETTFSSFLRIAGDFETSAMLVSMVSLGVLIFWQSNAIKRVRPLSLLPGPLVVVIFGVLFQVITSKFAPDLALPGDHLVTVPVATSPAEFVNLMVFPDWSRLFEPAVFVTAVTLAVVASLETLLCVEATDKLDPERRVTPTNRELLAQGVGNMASGLVGGLPVTQVIVRSSANIQSGGRTKLSAILHGVIMLVFVVAAPELLNFIPLAALASILFVVGYKLATPALFRGMWQSGPTQFIPFFATVVGIVATDLLTGIGIGLAIAIFNLLRRSYLNSHFLHAFESDSPARGHTVRLKLAEEVTFLNRGAIVKALSEIPDETFVTIDMRDTVFIDDDVAEVIEEFRSSAALRGLTVELIDNKVDAPPVGVAV